MSVAKIGKGRDYVLLLRQDHGKRIRLSPGRAGGAPNLEGAAPQIALLKERGYRFFDKEIEVFRFAEEIGFIGRNGID